MIPCEKCYGTGKVFNEFDCCRMTVQKEDFADNVYKCFRCKETYYYDDILDRCPECKGDGGFDESEIIAAEALNHGDDVCHERLNNF